MEPDTQEANKHITIKIPKRLLPVIFVVVTLLLIVGAYYAGRLSAQRNTKPIPYPFPQPTYPLNDPKIYDPPYDPGYAPSPTIVLDDRSFKGKLPDSIEAKYKELEQVYGLHDVGGALGMGAGIKFCQNATSNSIYIVWGNGGYTGSSHYFSKNGEYIGDTGYSDTPPFYREDVDVKIHEYSCEDIRVSKNYNPLPPVKGAE